MKKRILALLLALTLILGLASCATSQTNDAASDYPEVKIGVLVYSLSDEEVISFREYLESYIADVFTGVSFEYSDGITDETAQLETINQFASDGVNGILSFNSMDLKAEVEAAAAKGMYYMIASGNVSDEEFTSVEDNPYFLGTAGATLEEEYQAGYAMGQYMYENRNGDSYFVLSGGATLGNDMHYERTAGILEALQNCYGVWFDEDIPALIRGGQIEHLSDGALTCCVCPGYLDYDEFLDAAVAEFQKDAYKNVCASLTIGEFANEITDDVQLGMVDCYSTRTLQLFNDGKLDYIAGKYSSVIGPAFALMYNACTGYADEFRQDGKAIHLSQSYWLSDNLNDFVDKYTLATSLEMNAYNYEDLGQVCKVYNESATLNDLMQLANANTFENAQARRS